MMTREEAINRIKDHMKVHHIGEYPHIRLKEELDMSLTALRPVSRERVEKAWRGYWIHDEIASDKSIDGKFSLPLCRCSRCGGYVQREASFCPHCGAPMTDEAVEMVMERLEALHEIPPTT